MKKFVAILLTLMLVLGIGAAVAEGAEAPTTYEDMKTITITKNYELTNEGTVSPAETFNFTIAANSVTDAAEDVTVANMPMPTIGSVTYVDGEAGSATKSKTVEIRLPDYTSVGIYTYIIKETAGTTAGVTYYGKDILLKVTVIEQGGKIRVAAVHTEEGHSGTGDNKKDTFANTYEAGTLNVTKTVAGNLGDQSKMFDFTVTFTKPTGKEVKSAINAKVAGTGATDFNVAWDDKGTYTYTFQLKHGQTVSFENLPYGVTYTVTEAAADGYTTTKAGDSGTISAAEQTAAFTNTKTGEIDTGVTTENLPYVLLIGFVVLAGAALLLKRKAHNN